MQNIFFINNNTTLISAILASEKNSIDLKNSIAAFSRRFNSKAFASNNTFDLETCAGTEGLKQFLNNNRSPLNVFLPHDGPRDGLRMRAIKKRHGGSVNYLEEGALAYLDSPRRLSGDIKRLSRLPLVGSIFEKLGSKPWFGQKGAAFWGLSDEAFPWVTHNRYVLNLTEIDISQYYTNVVRTEANIVLWHPTDNPVGAVDAYKGLSVKKRQKPLFLKLHPDALKEKHAGRTAKFLSLFEALGAVVLSSDTIIEFEVLSLGHCVIGSTRTSLKRYVEKFGGEYISCC